LHAAQASLRALQSESAGRIYGLKAQVQQARDAYEALRGKAEVRLKQQHSEIRRLSALNERLRYWQQITDAESKSRELIDSATRESQALVGEARMKLSAAEHRFAAIISDAERKAGAVEAAARSRVAEIEAEIARNRAAGLAETEGLIRQGVETMEAARAQAKSIRDEAERSAQVIAGEAWDAKKDLGRLQQLVQAIENQISGYGDRYLVPMYSVLDGLSGEMGHTEAGKNLKKAREESRAMVSDGRAALCDYAEQARRETAIRFVLDAFNGKVDAILSRVKSDNQGTLGQQIRDAFAIVNHHGGAFRDARITDAYLASRLEELKWGAVAARLKQQERDEQRALREQARDEERVRREAEREQREAAKQAESEQRAMARLEAEMREQEDVRRAELEASLREALLRAGADERAQLEARLRSDAEQQIARQRAAFELEIKDRDERLQEALARGQRAKSMAEQTKQGNVYIISNIGSFGDGIYKIGMTRRIDPQERIDELGDASVPFDFDVHAFIKADDAPALERQLHRSFKRMQVNKVNVRREFFRLGIIEIREELERLGIHVNWTMASAAAEYRETLEIERRIDSDPEALEQWLRGQSLLESAVDSKLLGSDEANEAVSAVDN
jgi:hypothetical protein